MFLGGFYLNLMDAFMNRLHTGLCGSGWVGIMRVGGCGGDSEGEEEKRGW